MDDLSNLFRLLDPTLFRSLLDDLVGGRHDGIEIRSVQQLRRGLPLVHKRSLLKSGHTKANIPIIGYYVKGVRGHLQSLLQFIGEHLGVLQILLSRHGWRVFVVARILNKPAVASKNLWGWYILVLVPVSAVKFSGVEDRCKGERVRMGYPLQKWSWLKHI